MADRERERGDRSTRETLAIPKSVREIVDARDGYSCRVCGKWLGHERRAVHHIEYGGDLTGMGGRRIHDPDTMITVGWLPGDCQCHQLVHGNKRLWQPVLLAVVNKPGVTALQLRRWALSDAKRRRPSA
jgi:5-methylcytosine-specific restriction endonuclease McrA